MIKSLRPLLKILRPGTFISIQDQGRYGFRHIGVPSSGAMDQESFDKANFLLNNETHSAVLEIIGPGTVIEILSDAEIVLTGAAADVNLNEQKIAIAVPIFVRKGEMLSVGKFNYGNILYLGVKGGIEGPEIMGSRSGIPYLQDIVLHKETILYSKRIQFLSVLQEKPRGDQRKDEDKERIEAMKGPEYHWLSEEGRKILSKDTFYVSPRSNRMGYRLNGPDIKRRDKKEMLTSAVMPGTVQLLSSGQLIALMRDAQTTGGYPRILQITESGINVLSQKRPGDAFKFTILDML